jgi:HAD superfamily hydrolase (TIGR01509 family)
VPYGIIFDFDGVLADSELSFNTILAEMVSSLGLPTTADESMQRYMGKHWVDVIAAIERDIGHPVSPSFLEDFRITSLDLLKTNLKEVPGAGNFIEKFKGIPRCIASSSSFHRLTIGLDSLGLAHHFGQHVYSVDMVLRGKPHPDIFIFAAEKLGLLPIDCIVIEDSVSGVRAGVAAGMLVIGLCAGSHIRPGHAQRLSDAGAKHTAASWHDMLETMATLLEQPAAAIDP